MKCLNCGNETPDGAMFCDNCGQKLDAIMPSNEVHYCPNCGEIIEVGTEFCGNCGASVNMTISAEESGMDFCGSCGAKLSRGMDFCENCGAPAGDVWNDNLDANKRKKSILPAIITVLIAMVVAFGATLVFYKVYFLKDTENAEVDKDVSVSVNANRNQSTNVGEGNEILDSDSTIVPTVMPQPQTPVFTYTTASGVRGADTEGGQYSTDAVLSSDAMTKWATTKESNGGISEWIQINSSEEQNVTGVIILNGYHKSYETWRNNNRVKDCTISFSNGQSKNVTLNDTMDMIKIDLDRPVSTTYIRLTINSLYRGEKWNDTAITYLYAY